MSNREEKAHPAISLLIVVGGSALLWALIIWAVMALMGCAKAQPPKAPVPADMNECGKVYERVLAISLVAHLDPDHTLSKAEKEAGIELLDQEYRSSGKTQQFFAYCQSHLSTDQTSCMQNSNSFEDMSLCDKLFAAK